MRLLHFPADELTVPGPVTAIVRVSVPVFLSLKLAPTVFVVFIVTVQVASVPLHAPDQPVKAAPDAGVAVSVTLALMAALRMQVVAPFPQLMLPPVTFPGPVTATVRDTVALEPPENVAATDLALVIETSHVEAVPVHAPVQPVNVAPDAGVAVSATFASRL